MAWVTRMAGMPRLVGVSSVAEVAGVPCMQSILFDLL